MKRQIKLLIIIACIACFFYGCEDWFKTADDPWIGVNVRVSGKLTLKNSAGDVINFPESFQYGAIEISVGKAGNLGDHSLVYINERGDFKSNEYFSYKIYREQYIQAVAYVKSVPDTYTQINGVAKFTWAELYPKTDFGETTGWMAKVYPILQLKE